MPRWDVLGLGCVAVDEVLELDTFPVVGGKHPIQRQRRQVGGQTGNFLIAAARLGLRASYAGRLGVDVDSTFVRQTLATAGVDQQAIALVPEARPIRCTVLVHGPQRERTVLYNLDGALPLDESHPPAETVAAGRLLHVDQFGVEGMIRAARLARAAGIPVLADVELSWPGVDELLALTDHLMIDHTFARSWTMRDDPVEMVERLWQPDRAIVVVTHGAEGCWYRSRESTTVCHQPAWPVVATDSTGAGDAFRAGYAQALLTGLPAADRVAWASAVAACRVRDGEPPTVDRVESLRRLDADNRQT